MLLDTNAAGCWAPTNPGGNYTNNGYPSRVPTKTPPHARTTLDTGVVALGDGVITLGEVRGNFPTGGGQAPIYLDLIPFGVDASTHTFSFQVLGWAATSGSLGKTFNGLSAASPSNPPLWIPVWLGTYQATLSATLPGVATTDVGSGQAFASTLTCTAGPVYGTGPTQSPDGGYAGGAAILTPAASSGPGVAMVELVTRGFTFLEVIFTTGGVVTSCNCLYRKR